MLSKLAIVAAIALILPLRMKTEPQQGEVITITSGTAIRIVLNPSLVNPVMANSMLIQSQHGGSGIIYVLNARPDQTCNKGAAGTTLVAELAPASATSPGGSFTFPSNGGATNQSSGFDLRYWCVDGSNSGDVAIVSWDLRN